jgi:hypothetical protein
MTRIFDETQTVSEAPNNKPILCHLDIGTMWKDLRSTRYFATCVKCVPHELSRVEERLPRFDSAQVWKQGTFPDRLKEVQPCRTLIGTSTKSISFTWGELRSPETFFFINILTRVISSKNPFLVKLGLFEWLKKKSSQQFQVESFSLKLIFESN